MREGEKQKEREGKRRNQASAGDKTVTHAQVIDSKSSGYIIDSVEECRICLKKQMQEKQWLYLFYNYNKTKEPFHLSILIIFYHKLGEQGKY